MNQPAAHMPAETPATVETAAEETFLPVSGAEARQRDIEKTKREILNRLEGYTPVRDITNLPEDRLKDRYVIHCDQPLNHLMFGTVKAYAVTDEKGENANLYAAVCDPSRPYRYRNLKALEGYEHNHIIRVIDHGITKVSALEENRYVIIYEQPKGKSLAQLMQEGAKFTEGAFVETVMKPVTAVITSFEEMGINHCRLNPYNVFVGEKTVVGDCISQPGGFSNDFLYEPLERLLTSPQGTGGGTTKVDSFDLGVLAIELMHDLGKFRELDKATYTGLILSQGTYNIMTPGAKFSEGFLDFLIGTLSDSYEERWNSTQLNLWLGGKRFNLLRPTPPRDASRPYEFDNEEFFSSRALAHSFFGKWDAARNVLRDGLLARWMDQSIHKRDMADLIRRAINATGGENNKNQKYNNELLTKIISILDPAGPLRIDGVSFNLGGLGLLVSDAMRNRRQRDLTLINEIIDQDMPSFWSELQQVPPSDEATDTLWKLQKIQHYLRLKGMGFGMERALYDLNPHIPCMSGLVAKYHVSRLNDMLFALDAIAKDQASQDNGFVDRHLAAFLASHSGVTKEVSIKEVSAHVKMLKSPEVIVMVLLAKAQDKSGVGPLKGLSHWVASRILNLLENIHSMQTRRQLCRELLHAADHGHISLVLQCLINNRTLNADVAGFDKALKLFQINRHKISELRNQHRTRDKAKNLGITIASVVSIIMLVMSMYMIVKEHIFN